MSELTNIIASLGFPIVSCCAMGWYVKYITDQNNKRLDAMQEQHLEENKSILNAINNNTIALTQLTERLEVNK